MMTSGYYGTSKDSHPHGGTPDHILEQLYVEFGELFDPCPNNPKFDGLNISWADTVNNMYYGGAFVNPPYTRGVISQWVKKSHDEWLKGINVIMLIPSYTDTTYFHEYIYNKAELRFIKGRLKFKGYDNKPASFPSMLVIFRSNQGDDKL